MPKATKGKKIVKGGKKSGIKRNPLFESKARNFRVGNDVQPRRNLTRFVRWPRYILLQRKKRVLMQRLKVPPQIHQFTHTLDRNQAKTLFKLLRKYQPETAKAKKERLTAAAKAKVDGKAAGKDSKPQVLKYGLNHITHLIEEKKAKLVIIAHDVDPIELVLWLPALCRKQEVPFVIVRGKANLGKLVHKKTASSVALTDVRKEDQAELETLVKSARAAYNDNVSIRKEWGGGKLGQKSTHRQDSQKKALEEEMLKKQ